MLKQNLERQETVRGVEDLQGGGQKTRKKKTSVKKSRLDILTKASRLCERWCVRGILNESGVAQEA